MNKLTVNRSPETLMSEIVREFDKHSLRWCVVGDYRNFPAEVRTDLDVLIVPEEFRQAASIVGKIARNLIVQHKRYSRRAASWTFADRDDLGNVRFAAIDILGETPFAELGIPVSALEDILAARTRGPNGLWILPDETEFVLGLAKRLAKLSKLSSEAALDQSHTRYLSELYLRTRGPCRESLAAYLSLSDTDLVLTAAENGEWSAVRKHAQRLRTTFRQRGSQARPTALLSPRIHKSLRWRTRIRNPNGLFVAILGCDGSGKSLLQKNLAERLDPLFDRTNLIHLKPANRRVGDEEPEPFVDPHGSVKRNGPRSLAQIFHWMAVYSVGYWLFIFPGKIRQSLTIADRYHADILCDPRRYRYGGPGWASRYLIRFLPGPDLWLILDASADTIRNRTSELSDAAIEELCGNYRKIGQRFHNALIIDAEEDAKNVAAAATDAVLRYLSSRQRP